MNITWEALFRARPPVPFMISLAQASNKGTCSTPNPGSGDTQGIDISSSKKPNSRSKGDRTYINLSTKPSRKLLTSTTKIVDTNQSELYSDTFLHISADTYDMQLGFGTFTRHESVRPGRGTRLVLIFSQKGLSTFNFIPKIYQVDYKI